MARDLPGAPITSPAARRGEDMAANPDAWLKQLSAADISELESAAKSFLESGGDIGEMTAQDFPLPTLGARLVELRDTLINGRGFEVLRGLSVAGYTQKLLAAIFCGVGAHLGKARSQNAMGHILGHVRDVGADASNPNTRIYQTSQRQTFHTDSADVVGLLCIREAMEGGKSLLVSTITVFNEMSARRPDLVPLLFGPIATDRRGEVPEGEKPFFEIPVLNWHEDHLTGIYQRQYIDSAQRFDDALRLTPAHVEALDLFDELANDPALHFGMQLQPGDMQFVYNHNLLHDRTGFKDWPEPDKRRHLFRLWLSIPGDRALLDTFRQRYGSIEIGDRGGIITKDTTLSVPLNWLASNGAESAP
jgi:hypothetical protein